MKKEETTKDEEMQLIVSSYGVKELMTVKKDQQSQINVRINSITYVAKVLYFNEHITVLNFSDTKEVAHFLNEAAPSSQHGLILQPNLKLLPKTETIVESTEVKTCGFPNLQRKQICKPTITHGRISNTHTKFLTYDATTDPGSSGGPVVRKNGDYVLGVHLGRARRKSFREAAHVSHMREVIQAAKSAAKHYTPLDMSELPTSPGFANVWINNRLQGIATTHTVVDERLSINIEMLPSANRKRRTLQKKQKFRQKKWKN